MKKRSPALLEDIAPRGLKLDPSAGGSGENRAPLLNVLTYIQRAGKLAVRKSTQSIVRKLATLGTDADPLISQARAYVKKRDRECLALRGGSTGPLFDAIWDVYSNGSEAQKKKLSSCLGLYSDVLARTLDINPAEEKIRQGCQELGMAAALYGYGEARTRLRTYFDPAINAIISERYTDELQRELGEYGPDLRVRMEEDEEIQPILAAADRATSAFEDLTARGSQPVFRSNSNVGMNLIRHPDGTYTQSICYDRNRGPMPEARQAAALLELNARSPSRTDVKQPFRSEKIKRASGGPTRKAADDAVDSLDAAFEQLKATDPAVVASLAKRGLTYDSPYALGSGSTINTLGARGEPLAKLTFSFPRDSVKRGSGSLMGEPTYIASIGSTDFQKLASGITHKFLSRRAVRSRVSTAAFGLICDALAGPGKRAGDEFKGNIFDIFETIGKGGHKNINILRPFMLVVCYLIREASAGGGKEDGYDRPFFMQQYMKDAYDMNVGFHTLAAYAAENAGESLPPGVLDVRPGSKTPGIFDRISRASKSKSLGGMYRALRDNDVLRTIGVAGGNISIIDGDDDEQQFDVSGPDEIDLVQKRERVTRTLDEMIKDHIPDLIQSLVRSTNLIKSKPTAPNARTSLGGHLPLMTFCKSVAGNKQSSIAIQAMADMGCKHLGSLAFMQGVVTPLMVWTSWTKLSGEQNALPAGEVAFEYNMTREFSVWVNITTGSVAGQLAKHVSQLLHSQFVLPVIACLYVALHEFRVQRLLTETEFEQYYKALSALTNDAEIKFNEGVPIRLHATTVSSRVTAAGSYTMRSGLRKFSESASTYPQQTVGKVGPQLKRVVLEPNAPFIIDITDKYILPRDLPIDGPPAAPPPPPGAPEPSTPAASPTPAPSTVPPTDPLPAAEPARGTRKVKISEVRVSGDGIANQWKANNGPTKNRNQLKITVQSGGFSVVIIASADGNAANSQAVQESEFGSIALRSKSISTSSVRSDEITIGQDSDLKEAVSKGGSIEGLAEEVGRFLDKYPELTALEGVTALPSSTDLTVTVSPKQS